MRATDGYTASNISATTAVFPLAGGKYAVDYTATWGSGGTVTLEKRTALATTFVTVATAFAADGFVVLDLPAGDYKLVVATATAAYVGIKRIPGE